MTVQQGIEALDRLHAEMEKGEVEDLFDRIGVIIAVLRGEVDDLRPEVRLARGQDGTLYSIKGDPLVPDFVEIRDDPDAHPKQDGLVILEMIAYAARYQQPAAITDSLCDIDFFEDSEDYVRGVFHRVSEIPEACTHLREIAREMHLPE